MIKKLVRILIASVMAVTLMACSGAQDTPAVQENNDTAANEVAEQEKEEIKEAEDEPAVDDFRIGIVTGSYSQSEDDRRGAEAFLEKYGADKVTLAIYPDNFTEEMDITIQTIVNLADDPKIKAIIVNQAFEGTSEAFRQIHEKRPDILCIVGEAYEDFSEISSVADLVVNYDFVSRGYLMIHTAHELGCNTFVHISFPRHLSYESVSRQVAVMKAACDEFGMEFAMEEAPDPTTNVGVPGAQSYVLEHVPEWVKKYGQDSAYFCT
ncbi:MAG: DUF3798 domain-containing protein, partial [Lachnospiraceae bacterium]|nr:DUF3798 domain-containing protein [Lachnospiraceae bacterium]